MTANQLFQVQKAQKLQVIEDFAISIHVQLCIQPNQLTLTTLMFLLPCFSSYFTSAKGILPSLTVNLSLDKYNLAMGLLTLFLGNMLSGPSSDTNSNSAPVLFHLLFLSSCC